jgi:two-component sensor histidine kinase
MFPNNLFAAWSRRRSRAKEQNASVPSPHAESNSPPDGELQSAESRLHLALKENQRLVLTLQTVRHSAGNQLALLAALLSRQARGAEDPNIRRELQTAQLRVHAFANAMRLDAMGDLNEFVNAEIVVERAVESLLELAADAGVKIEVDAQAFPVQRDDAFSFALIINELAVNSLKHAFPQNMGGAIRIRFAREPSAVGEVTVLIVEDNGVGRTGGNTRAGLGATAIASAAQGLGAKLSEADVMGEGPRRGLRTTISKSHR